MNNEKEEKEIDEIKDAVSQLERRNRRLTWSFRFLLVFWLVTLSAVVIIKQANAEETSETKSGQVVNENSVLRVRGIVVVDEKGTERVQIGAPLPDPLSLGKRSKRQGAVSGVLLMDSEGNERSGYVTGDVTGDVFLTLDNIGEQTAMFYANPHTGSQLYVRDSDNGNFIQLNATGKKPSVQILRHGKTLFQTPDAEEGKK